MNRGIQAETQTGNISEVMALLIDSLEGFAVVFFVPGEDIKANTINGKRISGHMACLGRI